LARCGLSPAQKTREALLAGLGVTMVDVPLILVNGSRPGPRFVITGGVHGGEFTGVDATTRLAGLLEPDDVVGQLVIRPVPNPPAPLRGQGGDVVGDRQRLTWSSAMRRSPELPVGPGCGRFSRWRADKVIGPLR
jgi:hypothetical protein